MNDNKFLEELRSKTGPMHKKLEQTEVSQNIVSPSLDLHSYQKYLRKIHTLHQGIEEAVFPVLYKRIADINERKKLPGIKTDLNNTNTSPETNAVSFVDGDFRNTVPFCMGIMYVSEGSTLGGLHIVKNVAAALGGQVKDATNFLTVYGQSTGSKWKTFMQELESFQATCTEQERQDIIDGAVYGFERTYEIFKN